MTSETDPKGYTIYYEYDGFGRLKDAKDKDGNVLKTYQYHYQNQ
ncbi:MAG: RHS repeat protein [Chitinophagaceae bacterium]|nr:RHS repeat protein [Chitinophagaceae bacterium]